MHYSSYGSAASFSDPISQSAGETCRLYGTTVAYCTLTALVAVGSNAISSTSSYAITQQALLSYGQVPITAGPAAAQASVSSCAVNGNQPYVTSSSYAYGPTSTSSTIGPSHSPSATGKSTGLSTAAKAGIGAGVGVAVLGAIALIVALIMVRRKRAKDNLASPQEPPPSYDFKQAPPGTNAPVMQTDANGQRYELYQPQVKYEMPAGREVQEVPAGYDGWQVNPSGPRYELH